MFPPRSGPRAGSDELVLQVETVPVGTNWQTSQQILGSASGPSLTSEVTRKRGSVVEHGDRTEPAFQMMFDSPGGEMIDLMTGR
jgi:hypothetical protein